MNYQERKENGLCPTCGKRPPAPNSVGCSKCLEYQRKKYARYRDNGLCSRCVKNKAASGRLCNECLVKCKSERDQVKKAVFDAYGGKCTCCGEEEQVFLSLDHVNNDGAARRRNKDHPRGGADLCRWLANNRFPTDFQLLCHNCQWGKRVFGTCPHEMRRQAE